MAWQEAKTLVRAAGREIIGIATVCGTAHDPQDYERQCRVLRAQGILLAESNAQAVRLAAAVVGAELDDVHVDRSAEMPPARPAVPAWEGNTSEIPTHLPALFSHGPRVINVGLEAFATQLTACGVPVVHVDWRPPAGGDARLARILERLR
jgi:FdrA protein